MIRYTPLVSVATVQVFSVRAALDASTVTPGRTPPDASLTVPVRVACANASEGSSDTAAAASKRFKLPRITTFFLLRFDFGNARRRAVVTSGSWLTYR